MNLTRGSCRVLAPSIPRGAPHAPSWIWNGCVGECLGRRVELLQWYEAFFFQEYSLLVEHYGVDWYSFSVTGLGCQGVYK